MHLNREVMITVKNRQIIKGEEEYIELVTPGKFYKKENAYYAVYDETEISGMEGTTTTLKIEKNNVSLIRFGTTTSKMTFSQGVTDISLYQTPYGILELAIKPTIVDIDVDDNGGEIRLMYDLESEGSRASSNELIVGIH